MDSNPQSQASYSPLQRAVMNIPPTASVEGAVNARLRHLETIIVDLWRNNDLGPAEVATIRDLNARIE